MFSWIIVINLSQKLLLRGPPPLTLWQMSGSLNLRLTASAPGGKISHWVDPDCGIRLEALCAPEAGLRKYAENRIKHTGIPLSCPLSSPCHLRDGCRAWVSFFTPSVMQDHISLPPLIYAWLLHCTWPPFIILPEMVVAAANMSPVWVSPPDRSWRI